MTYRYLRVKCLQSENVAQIPRPDSLSILLAKEDTLTFIKCWWCFCMKSEKEIHGKREIKSLVHYRSKVSYHLSSHFWGDKSCFSRCFSFHSRCVLSCSLWMNCAPFITLQVFSLTLNLVSIPIFVRSPVTAYTNKHLILCRRKIFQLSARTGKSVVYKWSCKSVMEIVEKMISPVTNRSCKCQNTTVYHWRQELLSRFLRGVVGISFKLFHQGKFCLTTHVNELLMLMNFIVLWSVNSNTKNFSSISSSFKCQNTISLKMGISSKVYVLRCLHHLSQYFARESSV